MIATHPSGSTTAPVDRAVSSTPEGTEDMSWKWAIVLALAGVWWVRVVVISRRGFDPEWIDKMSAIRQQIKLRRRLRVSIHNGMPVCPDTSPCVRCARWAAQIAEETEKLDALVEACPVDVRWIIKAYRRWGLKNRRPAVTR